MLASIPTDLFVVGEPIVEKIIRALLIYVFLVVALRLAGKRGLAQLNSFDLVVLLTVSNLLQNAGIGNDNSMLGGWISVAALLAVNYLVVRFLFRNRKIGRFIEGMPTVLVEDGRVVHENLAKEALAEDALQAAIHAQGVEEMERVRRAILEPTGTIAVFEKQPSELEQIEAEEHTLDRKLDEILRRMDAIERKLAPR